MKDFLGHKLEIGDLIIIADAHGRNAGASLITGIITNFTPKNVKFHKIQTDAIPEIVQLNRKESLKCPSKVVLINPNFKRLKQ